MRSDAAVALLLTAAAATTASAAASVDKLRGVGPECECSLLSTSKGKENSAKEETVTKFYQDKDTFACISSPSVVIPAARVNDDYCDCPDGSDEPGTAACAQLSALSPRLAGSSSSDTNTTPALPGFYCQNKGHNAAYLPFTHVNDGICDYERCCDGSDENLGVGGVKCENRCKAIGNEWRRQDNQRKQSTANAVKKRAELVATARRQRQELQDWLDTSKDKLAQLEAQVRTLETQKARIERDERNRVVKAGSGTGGKAGVLAGLAKARLDEVKGTLDGVQKQSNVYRGRVEELEGILRAFKSDYNPNFNDEGVKRAVRAWDDYAARDQPSFVDAAAEADVSSILTDATHGIEWEQYLGGGDDESSDVDVLYRIEAYLPAPLRDWIDDQLRNLRALLVENGILAPAAGPAATESKAVAEARTKVDTAQRELDDVRRQRDDKQKALADDFGADDVFRALKGQCVQKDSGEYTYELCWLKDVTQISKKGGARNNMGSWERFDVVTADDDDTPDGRGLGSGERVALKYTNGAHCWQGPSRSTTVVLACAEHEELWRVVEEEKCVYRIEAGTPAVCVGAGQGGNGAGGGAARKDEL